jgi:hypothetical protein
MQTLRRSRLQIDPITIEIENSASELKESVMHAAELHSESKSDRIIALTTALKSKLTQRRFDDTNAYRSADDVIVSHKL